ncbi:UNVERIFIED_CONTAM: hypothetical protein FKN15_057385 [Acipenser sinensis]
MEPPSVKQVQLRDGEMSDKLEQLSQYTKGIEKELANPRAERPAAERTGPGWIPQSITPNTRSKGSPAAERIGPTWVPQSAVPDTQSQERVREDQPDGSDSKAGWRGVKHLALTAPQAGGPSTFS